MTNYFPQPICEQIWTQKYKFQTDREGFESDVDIGDTWARIAHACANISRLHNNQEERAKREIQFFKALEDFKFLPAGRITAGAGTERNVTLFNCFVMGTIPDSLDGIYSGLKEAALTMQQGGGIGYDFSTIRPKGAHVKGVESPASGPLSFMDVWDASCKTIMSAGTRRGAMMATIRCDHPDVLEFITAKADPLRLRNFNVSVLCTDAFMEAVAYDQTWDLKFDGVVYETVKAVDVWDAIMTSTYNQAEPGVIFIDRINNTNNLHYMETIAATNPCGEQPLPPYGACLLGSINLTKFVINPFTDNAYIDYAELAEVVRAAVRMLDSVIDVSNFPLEAQRLEAQAKRRMGLGITGLADVFFMMGTKYGDKSSLEMADKIMREITLIAYETSIELAKEIAPCPATVNTADRMSFINSGFMEQMPEQIRQGVLDHGIRNSHLMSIAPTGTISMYAGNVSSGCEPIFASSYNRTITRDDGTKEDEQVSVYSVHKYYEMYDAATTTEEKSFLSEWWNKYMSTAQDLEPIDHINMQAVLQPYIDSSISKTVNLPEDISYEDFKAVYIEAYNQGCKGCTTYRPNAVTGSVLEVIKNEEPEDKVFFLPTEEPSLHERPEEVQGKTYKLRWEGNSYYLTFNHIEKNGVMVPIEMFVNTQVPDNAAWISALTRMISAIFRRGGDMSFVVEELKKCFDPKGGQFTQGNYFPSLAALFGTTLAKHLNTVGYAPEKVGTELDELPWIGVTPDQCPSCLSYSLIKQGGCPTCQDCGYSKCG